MFVVERSPDKVAAKAPDELAIRETTTANPLRISWGKFIMLLLF
jgi:hypothetical protein